MTSFNLQKLHNFFVFDLNWKLLEMEVKPTKIYYQTSC